MTPSAMRGFDDRAPLAEFWAWVDAIPFNAIETVTRDAALGRLLATPVLSDIDLPDRDRAAINGFAVRAAETEGAGAYNPVAPPGGLHPISTGDALPPATDAVLPFEAVDDAGWVVADIASAQGMLRRGEQLHAGTVALAAGRPLRAQEIVLLAALGCGQVLARRRPHVAVVIAGSVAGPDLLTPLLAALLEQDGALTTFIGSPAAGADLLLIVGRTGCGDNDNAPAMLAAAGGKMQRRGLALRPGGSSGFGWLGSTPALLLPGDPLACLAAYEAFVARLVLRMSGRSPRPFRSAALARKIVSGVGYTDFARVRLAGDIAEPLGAVETAGIAGAVRADGYVLVPDASEGYPAGAIVPVHSFGSKP